MTTRSFCKVVGFAIGAFFLNSSVAYSDPSIPVDNDSGRFMRLIVVVPSGKTVKIDLNKNEKKRLDLSTPGIYELKVEDAEHRVAFIGKYDLRQELAKNKTTRIVLQSKYTKPAKGKQKYDGPTGGLGSAKTGPLPKQ